MSLQGRPGGASGGREPRLSLPVHRVVLALGAHLAVVALTAVCVAPLLAPQSPAEAAALARWLLNLLLGVVLGELVPSVEVEP